MWMRRYFNSPPAFYPNEVHWAHDPAGWIGGQQCPTTRVHAHTPKSSRLLHLNTPHTLYFISISLVCRPASPSFSFLSAGLLSLTCCGVLQAAHALHPSRLPAHPIAHLTGPPPPPPFPPPHTLTCRPWPRGKSWRRRRRA